MKGHVHPAMPFFDRACTAEMRPRFDFLPVPIG